MFTALYTDLPNQKAPKLLPSPWQNEQTHVSERPKQTAIKITAEMKENYSINHRISTTKQ
jgi:hypothetical protein